MKNIIIKTKFSAIHRWPDCPIEEVSYLRNPHRHEFYVKVKAPINHDDRDIEFIQFKRWINRLYDQSVLQLDYKSCEMIADDLYAEIANRYPGRAVWISVSEDDENGAFIQYNTTQPVTLLKI